MERRARIFGLALSVHEWCAALAGREFLRRGVARSLWLMATQAVLGFTRFGVGRLQW
jgi:hypothetical protein